MVVGHGLCSLVGAFGQCVQGLTFGPVLFHDMIPGGVCLFQKLGFPSEY